MQDRSRKPANPSRSPNKAFSVNRERKADRALVAMIGGASGMILIMALVVALSLYALQETRFPLGSAVASSPPEPELELEWAPTPVATQTRPFQDGWATGDVYVIRIDGEDILYLATEADADAVLEGVVRQYGVSDAEIAERRFAEHVEVVRTHMAERVTLSTVRDGIARVTAGDARPKVHVIRRGDNLWEIAAANGIELDALMEMNPGLDPRRLSVGQEVYVYETRPLLTVLRESVVQPALRGTP